MRRSIDRIHTTHVGSLPRPSGLLDLMRANAQGQKVDPGQLPEAEPGFTLQIDEPFRTELLSYSDAPPEAKLAAAQRSGRITRFTENVDRENVVASADCGFSSQATYTRRFIRRSSGPSSRHSRKEPGGLLRACGERGSLFLLFLVLAMFGLASRCGVR